MATTYRKQSLTNEGSSLPAPAPAPLTGLQPMRRPPATEALRTQDKVVGLGRRIVLSSGVRGDIEWCTPDVDPVSGSRTHPDRTTYYVVARGLIEFTSGSFLRLVGACVPSGETQTTTLSGGDYNADGPQGHLRVTVVWTDRAGATETTTQEIALPASTQEFGAQDTSAGGLWKTVTRFKMPELRPPDLGDVSEVRRWSRFCSAEITLEHRGSPRVVDVCVYEVPVAIASQDSEIAASALYTAGSPDAPPPSPLVPYAQDVGPHIGGVQRLLDTARNQRRIGPCLVQWTAYTETDATYNTRIVARTTANDGSTYENLIDSALTSFDTTTEAAWSVSCGGYGRRWAENSPFVLRNCIAVIPVLVRVYGRTITAGTGTFRFQTAVHSYVDVPIPTAGADAWVEAYGWLEVGINPDQPVRGVARFNHLGASGSLSVSAFQVYYCEAVAQV